MEGRCALPPPSFGVCQWQLISSLPSPLSGGLGVRAQAAAQAGHVEMGRWKPVLPTEMGMEPAVDPACDAATGDQGSLRMRLPLRSMVRLFPRIGPLLVDSLTPPQVLFFAGEPRRSASLSIWQGRWRWRRRVDAMDSLGQPGGV